MEGLSNGGMLYHEVQESKLCAVHCVNTALQGPFFSEFDLAALASDLDRKERQMILEGGGEVFAPEESHNVSLDGDFSIQVLQKALEVWDLQVIPLNSPVAEPAQIDPELENAFICHLQDHWFCIRKVNGEWYNFNSLYPAPEHLSKFYLSAYLDTLKSCGWSIFIVRGNFPKECPMASSEASNGFGQWLLPEDAERITKSCNTAQRPPYRTDVGEEVLESFSSSDDDDDDDDDDDEDLKAAISASLVYSHSSGTDAAEVAALMGKRKGDGLVVSSLTTAVCGGANSRDETNNNSSAGSVASTTAVDGAATSRDEMKGGLMESSSPTVATDGAGAGAAKDERKMTNE